VPGPPAEAETIAIFGPTAVGKTGIAIEVAEALRDRGEDPVAVNCDSIQVYEGLGVLSGAASAGEQSRLEHRLVGFVPVDQEFSAGRFAALARREIDSLLELGRRPIVVGGTGLYLRAALSSLELRPPVSEEVREQVEREVAERGAAALHAEISPALASGIHPRDRKRITRTLELQRSGLQAAPNSEGGGELWTASLRRPTLLAGIVLDPEELAARIDARVDRMVAEGAVAEARTAERAGASRTASAALGFGELISGDLPAVRARHRRYARRQMTWMRRMEGVRVFDRSDRSDREVAAEIVAALRGVAL
jgi:tRNA dimethylallyltransferase